VPSVLLIERLAAGVWAGYVDFGVVREREVRCEDLKTVRSVGRGMKGAFDWDGEAVVGSGSMTQFSDIVAVVGGDALVGLV